MDNDTEFVERARNGDTEAFKKLVSIHKKNVYYLAYDLTRCREDAEDVSQDVFVKVYRSLNKFKGDSKFSSWLYRITVNTCLTLKSSKSFSVMKTSENMEDLIDTNSEMSDSRNPNPEQAANSVLIGEHIEKALQKLSKREKAVFIMRNFSEMSFNEIVEILQLQPGTVRSAHFNALRKLRKELAFYKNEI